LINFQDSFTDRVITKFFYKISIVELTDVAALPCETAVFQKSCKFKNT